MKTKTTQKMKKSVYKPGILLYIPLLLISFTLSAQEEVTKEFHKEFTAGANSTLEISNKYGDVVVTSWDQNKVIIDVKVTVEMPNREKAEKLISYINVQFSENGNILSAKTIIDDNFNFSGWGIGSKKFSIDYTVKMPTALALTLSNRYGDTDIDELNGLVNLDIKYGNLKAGILSRGNVKPISKLNLAYGKASIDETGWLDIIVRYAGNVAIIKSQALLIDSKYSKVSLGATSSVVGESKYDNIRIESINNLILENGYTEVNIGTLTKKLEYNGSYGSFTVDRIPVGFESLDVETRYMGVRLGIESGATYKLDAKVSYGGLKYDENNFNSQRRIIENNSNEVAGIVGKEESPAAGVKIVASYGTVKLY
jgi:hypothetical protein